MRAQSYLLVARSAFHFGVRGVGIEAASVIGHADTLWSAFCLGLAELAGPKALDDFVAAYRAGAPPMLLTSAFPYAAARPAGAGEDWQPPESPTTADVVRFYPKPLALAASLADKPALRKQAKSVLLVSGDIFSAWVAGGRLDTHVDRWGDLLRIQGGQVWLSARELAQVEGWIDDESETISAWASGDVPRVTVDRVRSASQVFQSGRVTFQRGGGLWLSIAWGEGWREIGETVLRTLGDSGLGGERSAGHGQFRLAPLDEEMWLDPVLGGLYVNLALYWPQDADAAHGALSDIRTRYTAEVRRGYMASRRTVSHPTQPRALAGAALRKKTVIMAGEGSVLAAQAPGPYGGLAEVTPDIFVEAGGHSVLRYGYAFPVAYGGAT